MVRYVYFNTFMSSSLALLDANIHRYSNTICFNCLCSSFSCLPTAAGLYSNIEWEITFFSCCCYGAVTTAKRVARLGMRRLLLVVLLLLLVVIMQ